MASLLSGADVERIGALQLEGVDSSLIDALGWDKPSKHMVVRFKDGAVWAYRVPHDKYLAAQLSPSVGLYFHNQIKGRYPEARISQRAQSEEPLVVATPCYLMLLQLSKAIKGQQYPAVLYQLWQVGRANKETYEKCKELLLQVSGGIARNPQIKDAVPVATEEAKRLRI